MLSSLMNRALMFLRDTIGKLHFPGSSATIQLTEFWSEREKWKLFRMSPRKTTFKGGRLFRHSHWALGRKTPLPAWRANMMGRTETLKIKKPHAKGEEDRGEREGAQGTVCGTQPCTVYSGLHVRKVLT